MRKHLIIVLVFVCLGCQDDDGLTGPLLPPGSYEGTFRRWSISSPDNEFARVHFTFRDGAFSGGSNMVKYPAICNGKYAVTGSKVQFTNFCMWTADFDWTYILNGLYTVTMEGDEFLLTQKKGDWIDTYKLKRNSPQ